MHLEIAGGHVELDRPPNASALLVLTHGAGGGVDTADLRAIRDVAVGAGIAVARVLQPYRVAGRKTPPTPGPQDVAWLEIVTALRKRRGLARLPLVLGGRSNGARVACRTALATGAVGVVALAFPLHPPGRPEKTRLPELDGSGVSTLVVQGDRDPFGMPPPGEQREVVVIEGADHALKRQLPFIADTVTSFVTSLSDVCQGRKMTTAAEQLRTARDFLLEHRTDYAGAISGFEWPRPEHFNFAIDWFDGVLAAEHPDRPALKLIEADGTDATYTFEDLSERSSQLAGWLRGLGVRRGMHVLVLLGNQVELWETTLAAMKIGAVMIPATTLLAEADLRDRIDRGDVAVVIARSDVTAGFEKAPGSYLRIAVGDPVEGWARYGDSHESLEPFEHDEPTPADESLLLYFTSGTTALPKLVEHTHTSYPIGHLSTMFWLGLQPGDVHLNVSSPGWAKHAWSCVFAPWLAGATICLYNYERFDAAAMLNTLRDAKVTTFCAPPTVWRMLIQQDLAAWRDDLSLRELAGAGEPLNPEVIQAVERGLGITIRDGFGQTESSLQIGNSPGQELKIGSMGRPMPGFSITLVDPSTDEVADEGEICVDLDPRPVGLMVGYQGDHDRNADAFAGGRYHTGDVASRDENGYITYVGRADDVFKASDYRISPFELESVLIEHPAVAEAAIVPAPDELRLAVPKAYVVLVQGQQPSRELAGEILTFCREHLAPYKRIRRLEFAGLPKTISGKIRRVELRNAEAERVGRSETEYREEDFR